MRPKTAVAEPVLFRTAQVIRDIPQTDQSFARSARFKIRVVAFLRMLRYDTMEIPMLDLTQVANSSNSLLANFRGLVLFAIEAKFRNQILV